MALAGAVLSGGISKRFGGDKLLARVEGTTMIRRVCGCLRQVTDELYLSVNSHERGQQLEQEVRGLVDSVIPDSPEIGCVGPIRGIGTIGSILSSGELLVTSGDTPWLQPEPLRKFVGKCRNVGVAAGSIIWGNGMVDTLIQYLKIDYLRSAIERICTTRGDMARPSDLLRGAPRLGLIHAASLTENPNVFSNVNTPSDLMNPSPRGPLVGTPKGDVVLDLSELASSYADAMWSSHFWRASYTLADRNSQPEQFYEKEGELFLSLNVHHLAVHAFTDALRCAETINSEVMIKRLAEKKERAQKLMQTQI